MSTRLRDNYGRTLDYLRISVTEQCNFRCVYCMPPEGLACAGRATQLTFAEIARVARCFVNMGGRVIKLTGGEPLVRPDLPQFVAMLAALPGLDDLGLTTNGYFLAEHAADLRAAGLQRVNVSLDSLDPARFAALTGSAQMDRVWAGIEAALRVGLQLKINVVAMKGLTQADVARFAAMATTYPVEIRCIEFMPLCGGGWHPEWMLPLADVEAMFHEELTLAPIPRGRATAKSYRVVGGLGRVGFIASLTEPFCAQCSRLRLTADGKLRPCLFSTVEVDLAHALRAGVDDADLQQLIATAVARKPPGHGIAPGIIDAGHLPRIRALGG